MVATDNMTTEDQGRSNPRSGGKNTQAKDGSKFGSVGIEDLKGNVYSYGVQGQAERFMRTTKAIAEYVGITHSKHVWVLLTEHKEPTFEDPEEPDKEASRGKWKKYEMLLKMVLEEERKYEEDRAKVF